jgi:hypothetical protein
MLPHTSRIICYLSRVVYTQLLGRQRSGGSKFEARQEKVSKTAFVDRNLVWWHMAAIPVKQEALNRRIYV